MSTEIICPDCGGIIFSASGDTGRTCTCGKDPSTAVSSESASGPVKVCVNCGLDVTNEKRLKDKEGNYWCVKCGAEDSRKKKEAAMKKGGGAVVCPDCCRRFAKDDLHTSGGDLICSECLTKRVASAKKASKRKFSFGSGAQSAEKRRLMMLIVLAVVLIGFAIYRYI